MAGIIMKNKVFSVLCFFSLLTGCSGKVDPRFVPVEGFELSRYLGTWYEIARLDHPFEKGLEKVTAEYSLRDDGRIRIVNRGYDPKKDKWKKAEGRAELKYTPDTGWLKVSFFRPFYADYMILELDRINYSYALVSGPNTSYLWILSRTPVLEEGITRELLSKAATFGFNPEDMIFVEQDEVASQDPQPGRDEDPAGLPDEGDLS